MKYRSIWIALTLLLLFSAAGCGRGTDGGQNIGEQTSGSSTSKPEQKNIAGLPAVMLKKGWPKDLVPPELPEYAEGTVVNSGEDDGTLYIKIRETDTAKLEKYLEELKKGGWIVTGGSDEAEAIKGMHTVDFEWQDGGKLLQMTLRTGEAGSWPSDKIPPDILQPQTGVMVDGVEIMEATENAWYFNYTYDGMDEAAAKQYLELLRQNGWSGDDSQLYKAFEWKDQKYAATIEIYETIEIRTTFTCNFYYEN